VRACGLVLWPVTATRRAEAAGEAVLPHDAACNPPPAERRQRLDVLPLIISRMLRLLQGATLVAAAMTMGMMAGVFVLYAHTIMPGLGRTDDRTFVAAFQAIDRAIINPLFLPTFFGALVLTGLAAALHFREARTVLPWLLAAFVLYLAVVIITMVVNVPLNDGIKAAGSPDQIGDLAGVRARFNEARWMRWNVVRAVATTLAFGCLAWALVQFGRTGVRP
jgi:uncharacterized membrane protein